MAVVGLYDRPDGRWYVHPLDEDVRLWSVTTVLSMTRSKPWLVPYAGKKSGEFCVRNFELVRQVMTDAGDNAAIAMIAAASRDMYNLKADIGTHVHDVQEAIILNAPVPGIPTALEGRWVEWGDEWLQITPEWINGVCDGFLQFVADFDVEFEMAEATVAHPGQYAPGAEGKVVGLGDDLAWAGTLDWIAVLKKLRRGARLLGDTKTGRTLGNDVGLQLAAYRHCTEVWLDKLGNVTDMPRVHGAAVLHVRPEFPGGYRLLEQPADVVALRHFERRLRTLLDHDRYTVRPTGRPLYPDRPDGSQPPPLLLDVDVEGFNHYRKPLIRAGFANLAEVAELSPEELLTIRGLGQKAPAAVLAACLQYGIPHPPPPKESPNADQAS